VQFSPVDKVLVSASGDCTLKVWSLLDGQIVHNLEGHTGSILKVTYLCFGLMLLSSDVNGVMKLWNVKK
jgi:U3 small nucleolar RNA-associated protein 13